MSSLTPLPTTYRTVTWRPQHDGQPKYGLPLWPNYLWYFWHKLGLFANAHAGVLMIFDDALLVHRSLVTPRWYRFPNMAKNDLQIGDTWTHPSYRGKGLAKAAILAIHLQWKDQFYRMWYVAEAENTASIRVIRALGYTCIGEGQRTSRLGLRALGQFRLRDQV